MTTFDADIPSTSQIDEALPATPSPEQVNQGGHVNLAALASGSPMPRIGATADKGYFIDVDGSQRPVTNSNGECIHSTEEGMRNFWRWFGDSQVVDDDGRPLVVYHGTNIDFEEFDKRFAGSNSGNLGHMGYGFYFSTDAREAGTYGEIKMPTYIKQDNPFTGKDDEFRGLRSRGAGMVDPDENLSLDAGSLIDAIDKVDQTAATLLRLIHDNGYSDGWETFLRSEDRCPSSLDLNDVSDLYVEGVNAQRGLPEYTLEYLERLGISDNISVNTGWITPQSLPFVTDLGNLSIEVTAAMRDMDHDGVWYGSEVVAFEPTHIKSAVGNGGSFDVNASSIFA